MSKGTKGKEKKEDANALFSNCLVNFNVAPDEQNIFLNLIQLKNIIDCQPDIRTNKEAYAIFVDPQSYFQKNLKQIHKPFLRQIMDFTVYAILRKVYSENGGNIIERVNPDGHIPIRKIRDYVIGYLSYAVEILKLIIDKGNDAIMDGYNEKVLSETSFNSLIKNHNNLMAFYKQDRDDLVETIDGLKAVMPVDRTIL